MGSHLQFVQLCSRHLPPEKLQSGPCFLHVQRLYYCHIQFCNYNVLLTKVSVERVGFFFFILIGITFPLDICHPNSDGFNVSFPTHDCTWW